MQSLGQMDYNKGESDSLFFKIIEEIICRYCIIYLAELLGIIGVFFKIEHIHITDLSVAYTLINQLLNMFYENGIKANFIDIS
jgi:hypothetical protein